MQLRTGCALLPAAIAEVENHRSSFRLLQVHFG